MCPTLGIYSIAWQSCAVWLIQPSELCSSGLVLYKPYSTDCHAMLYIPRVGHMCIASGWQRCPSTSRQQALQDIRHCSEDLIAVPYFLSVLFCYSHGPIFSQWNYAICVLQQAAATKGVCWHVNNALQFSCGTVEFGFILYPWLPDISWVSHLILRPTGNYVLYCLLFNAGFRLMVGTAEPEEVKALVFLKARRFVL